MAYQSGFSVDIEPTEAEVNAAVLRQNFLSGKPQLLLLRSSTDWMKPTTYIINEKPLYLKSTHGGCQPHLQNAFIATPRFVFD